MKSFKLNLFLGLCFLIESIVTLLRSLDWYRVEKVLETMGAPVSHPTDFWAPGLSFLISASFLWTAWKLRNHSVPGSERYYPGTKAVLSFIAAAGAGMGAYFYGSLLWERQQAQGTEAIFPDVLWVGFWVVGAIYALVEARRWVRAWRKSRLDPREELLPLR